MIPIVSPESAELPLRLAGLDAHLQRTVISVGGVTIGGGGLTILAGPCSVESAQQLSGTTRTVFISGADILRAGAFKPRTSPYDFQGLGGEGLKLLSLVKAETGMPVISEITDVSQLSLFDDVDIIQVGARNMQNFELLRALGRQRKPVMIKRGLAATYDEWLMSAEYVMSEGNENVILCERGIRTFERHTRATLDIGAIPVLRRLTHLPIVVDPSHAAGRAELVAPLAMAAVAAGADGIMVEVHCDPAHALSDGQQALRPDEFVELAQKLRNLHNMISSK